MAASIAANRGGLDEWGDDGARDEDEQGRCSPAAEKQKEAPWTSSCSFRRTAGEELGRLEHNIEQGGAAAG